MKHRHYTHNVTPLPPQAPLAVLGRAGGAGAALSSLSTSTIAASCARRTVAGVIAIRAHLGAVDPDRKKPR